MSVRVRVTAVGHLGGRALRIAFSDGLVRELDFEGVLVGLLSSIDNDEAFAAVTVDEVSGTVCWPGGIDLDPVVLHGDEVAVSAVRPRVLREYRLQQTQ